MGISGADTGCGKGRSRLPLSFKMWCFHKKRTTFFSLFKMFGAPKKEGERVL